MSQPEQHQQCLLKAAQHGDDDALAELIENFRPLLRADSKRTLVEIQGRIDASDVDQLTWWSAFRAFPRFTGDVDAFVGWLRNIHEGNLRDAMRDQHAEKRAIGREVAPSGSSTFVNGQRVTECDLRLGDQIQIGETTLQLSQLEAPTENVLVQRLHRAGSALFQPCVTDSMPGH